MKGALAGEADEGLVHQCCGLQSMTAAFARDLPARHAPDVVVDQRPERIERRGVAVGPALQETGDFALGLLAVGLLVVIGHAALWRESDAGQSVTRLFAPFRALRHTKSLHEPEPVCRIFTH